MVGLGLVGDAYVMTTRGPPDTLAVVGAWAQVWFWYLLLSLALIYLPLLFPDSRLPSRWWLPVAVLAGIRTLGMVLLGILTDTLHGTIVGYKIDNPIGIEGEVRIYERAWPHLHRGRGQPISPPEHRGGVLRGLGFFLGNITTRAGAMNLLGATVPSAGNNDSRQFE
jgi:hypothetical protein